MPSMDGRVVFQKRAWEEYGVRSSWRSGWVDALLDGILQCRDRCPLGLPA